MGADNSRSLQGQLLPAVKKYNESFGSAIVGTGSGYTLHTAKSNSYWCCPVESDAARGDCNSTPQIQDRSLELGTWQQLGMLGNYADLQVEQSLIPWGISQLLGAGAGLVHADRCMQCISSVRLIAAKYLET